jgi:antitoxin component of RelBE/YafQ-DinJ toxin-antitoxin module
MKLQVTVDDALGHELQNKAHDLGLSLSSYVRYMLKKSVNKSNLIDLAADDVKNGRVENISLEDFKKQIQELM